MEAGRALVAFEGVADTLEHDVSAWQLGADSGPEAFANALTQLLGDPVRAARLGRGARAVLDAEHAWPVLAARMLRLLEALGARDRPRDGR